MSVRQRTGLAFLIMLSLAAPAGASVYSDDFGKCLVKATTDTDKASLVKWIFAAFSAGPVVASMSKVTVAERQGYNRAIGKLMDRLVLSDCRQAAIDAVKADGPGAFQTSFELLGAVAARQLISDPVVGAEMQSLSENVDKSGWADLMKAAGVAAPAK
ncbi:hypothetical protein ACFSGX_02125 [Sphingomonas arantia]|uniref:Uncharacterized protein n=1 Tax=Sphingomonas arantia TaxID=1460676 RepID=A0ABW4TSA0_9SPHN